MMQYLNGEASKFTFSSPKQADERKTSTSMQ